MDTNCKNDVQALQTKFLDSIDPDYLLGLEIDDLNVKAYQAHCGIRVFPVQRSKGGTVEAADVRYVCESVFSGIESFCQMSLYYRMVSTETLSGVDWSITSLASFRQAFGAKYDQLLIERYFPRLCRLLLELFKLQIVFTGIAYD